MSSRSPIAFAVSVVLAGAVLLACGSEPPTPESAEPAQQGSEALTICTKGGCCVGAPAKFDLSDPFQAQLAAWGCANLAMYTVAQGTNDAWYSSKCPDPNQTIETFLAANPVYAAPPYSAQIVTTTCAGPAPKGGVVVLWDPTCTTCKK